jgi:hypothetical protein
MKVTRLVKTFPVFMKSIIVCTEALSWHSSIHVKTYSRSILILSSHLLCFILITWQYRPAVYIGNYLKRYIASDRAPFTPEKVNGRFGRASIFRIEWYNRWIPLKTEAVYSSERPATFTYQKRNSSNNFVMTKTTYIVNLKSNATNHFLFT